MESDCPDFRCQHSPWEWEERKEDVIFPLFENFSQEKNVPLHLHTTGQNAGLHPERKVRGGTPEGLYVQCSSGHLGVIAEALQ